MYLFIYLFNRRMLLKHCGKSKRGLSYIIITGLHSKTHHQSAISFSPPLFILSSYELICSPSLHALIHHTGKGRCLVLMCERFHQVAPCSKFTVHFIVKIIKTLQLLWTLYLCGIHAVNCTACKRTPSGPHWVTLCVLCNSLGEWHECVLRETMLDCNQYHSP